MIEGRNVERKDEGISQRPSSAKDHECRIRTRNVVEILYERTTFECGAEGAGLGNLT